ncbi:ABC transporter ATP-binding protein [Acinetobacter sp. Ac_5812]|uniref:ABC transporter ATP-binding protein n=1 Tax=Acinetobacter sp. Ac_5812 TaxID=1848937 RepID=UPI002090E243|nr:ABC transporter ATP-binding protein [Acinetobacter sp. Ac_5812]
MSKHRIDAAMCASRVEQVRPQDSNPLNFILKPIRGYLVLASLTAALGAMLSLVPVIGVVYLVKALSVDISILETGQITADTITWIVLGICCLLIGMLLITLSEFIAHLADHKITGLLTQKITQRLTQVPLGWFTSRNSGEVKQLMQDDIGLLHSLTAHFFPAFGRAIGTISIAAIFLFMMDWRMAILALLPFVGFFFFLGKALHASESNIQEFATQLGRINSAAIEFIHAIPIVKTFGQTGQASASYQQAVYSFAQAFKSFTRPLIKSMAHAHALISPITILGVVLICAALFTYLGWLHPLDVLPFVLVAPAISAPVLLLHTLLHDVHASQGAAQRVLALLKTPILDVVSPQQSSPIQDSQICFNQVSYAYDAKHPVVSQLNFSLEPNTVTAIVGSSGAGKSTIAQLLLRFFDPTEGHITLGGVDLREIAPSVLYQHIGFVLQDTRLIHASIAENIALGRSAATQAEIEQAAKAANIHQRIMAEAKQYAAIVGDDIQLSGGERQRIAIARAILLNSPVLVLDEATAAADVENEIAIQEALAVLAQGRTVLVIAHRLNTIMHADQIIVLDQGKVIEQGTHTTLLNNRALYAQLWTHTEKHASRLQGVETC